MSRPNPWIVLSVGLILGLIRPYHLHAAQGKPYLMGAMGDSMTAASFSNTDLGSARNAERIFGLYENKDTFSWATGKKISSHYMALAKYLKEQKTPASLEYLNVSEPGGQTDKMASQAQKLADAIKTGKYESLLYVTLLIGANDVCSEATPGGMPDEDFKANLKAGFAKLAEIKQSQKIHVLVPGIPRVLEIGRPEIRALKVFAGLTCDKVLNNIMKYCPKFTKWTQADEYREKLKFIRTKNDIMKTAVDEARLEHKNLEIHFTNPLFDMEIGADILSADCFHPNAQGQELLSQILWFEQPWFK